MPQKVLFLISSLRGGGVSKSLVNLLHSEALQAYDISLWVGCRGGLFEPLLPRNIRVLSDPIREAILAGFSGLPRLLVRGHLLLAAGSLLRCALSCCSKSAAGWLLAQLLPPVREHFDAIIDFNGQHQLYHMVDHLHAPIKITFFHSDYSKWPYYYRADKRYFPRVTAIFSCSETCVRVLRQWFPNVAANIRLMENISSPQLIRQLADIPLNALQRHPAARATLVTVGHVCRLKGCDLILAAAAELRRRRVDFVWYLVGEVRDAHFLRELREQGLEQLLLPVGATPNPYPYMARADIVVHPSRFEGKPLALDEAKLLCCPIVATNFSTVADQLTPDVNASICPMEGGALADAIDDLLQHPEKRQRYREQLAREQRDNSDEIHKLLHIIDHAC